MPKFKIQDKPVKSKLKFDTPFKGTILAGPLDRACREFDQEWTFTYEPKMRDLGWHPSGDCLPAVTELYRKAITALTPSPADVGVPSPRSSNSKAFMVGHFWHQWIQTVMVHEGWVGEENIESFRFRDWGQTVREPFHFVRGQADIVPFSYRGWTGLVDIKTMGSNDFKQNRVPTQWADKYLCQINIYMDLFDQEQAMILAVNKDSGHGFQEFTFVRNQPLIDAIYRKWEYVSACIEDRTDPSAEDDEEYRLPL